MRSPLELALFGAVWRRQKREYACIRPKREIDRDIPQKILAGDPSTTACDWAASHGAVGPRLARRLPSRAPKKSERTPHRD